jgi:peptidoglycan hydrolase-like protein with peptidoglycan-binding domain
MTRLYRQVAAVGAAAVFGFSTAGLALAAETAQPHKAASPPTEQKAMTAKPAHKAMHKRVARHSAVSEHVKAVQEALIKDGAKIKADGIMGRQTRSALQSFQKQNGLKVTGKADQETLKKLGV